MSIFFIFLAAFVASAGGTLIYQWAVEYHEGQYSEDYERRYRAGFADARPGEYRVRQDEQDRVVYAEQSFHDEGILSRTQVFDRHGRNLNAPPNPLVYALGAFVVFVFVISCAFSVNSGPAPSGSSPAPLQNSLAR